MMVARICQLYPYACGATIVTKFFHLIGKWRWPNPIELKKMEEGPLMVRVWNPMIYPGDRRHLMPIITPAYPQMCATHNITHSTKAVIIKELKRADEITSLIVAGKKHWRDLFERHNFFTNDYKYYLSIVSGSKTKDAQEIWSGLVQSRVRRLVSGIEMSDTGVELAHPFNKGFDRIHQCQTEEEVDMIFQGDLRFQVTAEKAAEASSTNGTNGDANGNEAKGPFTIYTSTYYIGLEVGTTEGGGRKLDITNPVAEFKRQCTEWPQYNADLNSLRTVHTRK
jgi:poly(A) polymerase